MNLIRQLTLESKNETTTLDVSIEFPVQGEPVDIAGFKVFYYSKVSITGNGIGWSENIRGIDAISVLQVAFQAIRLQLDALDGITWWLQPGDNGGFPREVPQMYGPEKTARLEKALAAELEAIFPARSPPGIIRTGGAPAVPLLTFAVRIEGFTAGRIP